MSNSQLPHQVFLQFSGNYYNSSLLSHGMPKNGIGFQEITQGLWTDKKKEIINFIKKKLEPFNVNITTDLFVFNNTSLNRRSRVIFLPNKDGQAAQFYNNLIRRLLRSHLDSIAFPSIRTAFVFIRDRYQFDQYGSYDLSGLQDYGMAVLSQLLGVSLANVSAVGSGRFSWSAVNRLRILENSMSFYKQWNRGGQDPVRLLGTRYGYIKPPTPTNIANKSQYSNSLILTKQRLITRNQLSILKEDEVFEDSTINPGYVRTRDYVITGMIGSSGDRDLIKIALDAGTYKLMEVHLPSSMVDLKIELLDPMAEVPKDKNKLNLPAIKNECATKISAHPRHSTFTPSECFGLDLNLTSDESLLESSRQFNSPSCIEFTLKKKTFVYISVNTDSAASPNGNYSSIGKYAIGLINVDRRKVSNDYIYPSCYMHWALNPDPITLPERKLGRISILQNGSLKEVGFYLQEKDDSSIGNALIKVRKLNTVINGKLVELKYVVDFAEYDLQQTPRPDEHFYLTVASQKDAKAKAVHFFAGIMCDFEENPPQGNNAAKIKYLNDLFITDTRDVEVPAGVWVPIDEDGNPVTPTATPQPTPTPTPTPACNAQNCGGTGQFVDCTFGGLYNALTVYFDCDKCLCQPVPTATPQTTPAATPQATPAATPQATPAATPQPTPTATPQPTTPTATPTEQPCNCQSRIPNSSPGVEFAVEDSFFSSCPPGYSKGSFIFFASCPGNDIRCVNCYPDN